MKRAHTIDRRQAGVSIIEVVVAASLLLLAVVPILKALTTAQVTGRIVEQKTQSLALAQGKICQIQAQAVYDFSSSYDETGTALMPNYLCNVSDNEDSACKTLSVSVGYDLNGDSSLAGSEVLVTLTTLIAKRSD